MTDGLSCVGGFPLGEHQSRLGHLERIFQHDRQRKVVERITLFNGLAAARGLALYSPDATPIRFVKIGDGDATYSVAAALMRDGFYTNPAVFPAVSQSQGGLRVALTLHQTLDDIRGLVDAIARRV